MIDLAVLGLLRKQPRHGYELKARLLELGFLRISFGTLYPALRRLEKKGFIAALRQSGRRKAYKLTATGEEELARILNASDDDEDRRFNMRLAFFQYLEPAARLRTLKRRRNHLVGRLKTAQAALRRSLAEGLDDHYTAALLRHNIGTTEADIDWLNQLIAYARTEQEAEVPRTLMGGNK
ncbi:MAG: helix-turn-helix transcriptional regulator [bacterium]|nr:helix-turn-helix transcriptional regulator [bacterium]